MPAWRCRTLEQATGDEEGGGRREGGREGGGREGMGEGGGRREGGRELVKVGGVALTLSFSRPKFEKSNRTNW